MSKKFLNHQKWLKDLAGAWIFYTIFPLFSFAQPRFKHIARYAPIIGLFIGLIQSVIWIILEKSQWPKESIILVTLTIGIWVNGGLHFDGLIDTADGLGAGKEKCLIAMQDSRVGSSGLITFFLILIIQIAALFKLDNLTPLIFPISAFWGRVSTIWAIGNFSYLHKKGTANFHKIYWEGYPKELTPSFFIIITSILLLGLNYNLIENLFPIFISYLIGICSSLIVPNLLGKKLGGHSGDSYGASVIFTETLIIFLLAIII